MTICNKITEIAQSNRSSAHEIMYSFCKVVTWIAVCEKRANWEKNFRNGEGWTPAVFENVQANYTLKGTSVWS